MSASLQCIGGALEFVGGWALAGGGGVSEGLSAGLSTPASIPAIVGGMALVANGVDNVSTGVRNLIFNVPVRTLTESGISALLQTAGLSRELSDAIGANVNAGMMGAGGIAGAARSACCSSPRLVVRITPSAAETTAAGDHIVLGLEKFGLQETATQVGGRTLMGDVNWQTTLQTSLANPSTRFTVSLDGVSGSSPYSQFMNAAQQGLGKGAVQDNLFNWEMGQVYQAGRQGTVNFMQGGRAVPNPFQ